MQLYKVVTWYGQYHIAPSISIFEAPWSSSAPAWHHDLHHRVSMKLSTPCNYFTLLLTVSCSSRINSWRDNFMKTRWWRSWWWRSWCHAGDKHDHGAPKMEIKGAIWYWPYHVTIMIACDVYHVFPSCLLRTTVVNKMIPYNNFKKVFPLTVRRC